MSRLNVKLMIGLVGGTILLLAGVHFLHAYQLERNAGALLEQAEEAQRDGLAGKAMGYYSQYLKYRDDPQGYSELAILVTNIAEAPDATLRDRINAYHALEEAVRRHPELSEVRRRLADYTMRLGRPVDAMKHLDELRREDPKNTNYEFKYAQCQTITGHEDLAFKLLNQIVGLDARTQTFNTANARNVHEVDAYVLLADLLRRRNDDAARADMVMEQLLTTNPKSAKAYLESGRYYTTEKAKPDLEKAAKLAPNDPDVILSRAALAISEKDFKIAQQLLDNGVRAHPKNEGMYRALAALAATEGKADKAMEYVQRGLKVLPNNLELRFYLADMELQRGELSKARKSIAELEKGGGFRTDHIELLKARILVSENKWLEAGNRLERLRPIAMPDLRDKINGLLMQIYKNLGQPDRQLQAAERLLAADPGSVPAKIGQADALSALGRPQGAAMILEIAKQLPDDSPLAGALRNSVLQIRISEQLKKPEDTRDWSEVDGMVSKVLSEKTLPDAQKTILRAEVQMLKNDLDGAQSTLLKGRKDHPKEASIWLALVNLKQRQFTKELEKLKLRPQDRKKREEANADALAKFLDKAIKEVGDMPDLRIARAAVAARQSGDAKPTLDRLEKGIDKFTDPQQVALWSELGVDYLRIKDPKNARRCWNEVVRLRPEDARIKEMQFGLAVDTGDEEGMDLALENMRQVLGATNPQYRLSEAQRTVWKVRSSKKQAKDSKELAQIRKILDDLERERPEWADVPRVRGEIDELQGRIDDAIISYQRALDLAPTNANLARKVVTLNYGTGRFGAAAANFDLARGSSWGDSDVMTKLAAEMNFASGKTKEALEAAKKAVEAEPDDARNLLWYGQMLQRAGLPDRSEDAFRNAVKIDPKLTQGWLMLVANLAGAKKKLEAGDAIRDAKKSLPADEQDLTLAQCYEMLGNQKQAEDYYLSALKAKPDDLVLLRNVTSYADRMLKRGKTATVKEEGNLVWARRAKAQLLSAKGDYQSTLEAVQALEQNSLDGKLSPEDVLMLAEILGRRPESSSRGRAIKLLEEMAKERTLNPDQQLRLAQLYERAGDWPGARKNITDLLSRSGEAPIVLSIFSQMLLRHDEMEDATPLVAKLDKLEPKAPGTILLKARLLAKQGDVAKAVKLLEGLVPERPAKAEDLPKLGNISAVLEELGQVEPAEKLMREYADQDPLAVLALAAFLGRHGKVDESFQLCDKSKSLHSLATIVQVAIQSLRTNPKAADKSHFAQVEAWITEGLKREPASLTLQLQSAELRDLEGKPQDVIKIYRDVLAREDADDRQKAIVRNNLAFILAVNRGTPADADEALDLAKKAMTYLGPTTDLLDTQAMARLARGDVRQAINDLKVAIADVPSGTKCLHLSFCEMRANNKPAAREAYNRALNEFKLNLSGLSPAERALHKELVQFLGIKPAAAGLRARQSPLAAVMQ